MCNPLLFALALTGGGVAANAAGARKAEKASVNVRRAEDSRQNMYQQQAEAGFAKNMKTAGVEDVIAKQGAATTDREQAYSAASMAAPRAAEVAASGSMGGNRVVAGNLAQAMSGANERVAQLGNARARLNSFGDAMFDTNLQLGRGREEIGLAANLSANSLRPMEAEMGAAAKKGDKLKMLGTILMAAGSAAAGGAGAAAGAAAGTGATAATTAAKLGSLGAGLGSAYGGQNTGGANYFIRRAPASGY
jgi:hypothetical protein